MPKVSLPILTGLLLILCLALGLQFSHLAMPLDNQMLDQQFRLLRQIAPKSLDNDVVIVGIDEKTYLALPEPNALWHPHIGRLLRGMAQAKPAVVGFDIVLPVRSYNFLIPQYDVSLLLGIRELRTVAPLVLGQPIDENRNTRQIFPPYVAMAGQDSLAYVVICKDNDGVARHFTQNLCAKDTDITTLAGRMANHLGIRQIKSGFIDYSIGAPFNYIPMLEVLNWIEHNDQERLKTSFAGKAVLFGAVLPFEDRHRLPVPLAAGEPETTLLPGVLVHAQALRSLLTNGMIQPAPSPLASLLAALGALFWLHPGNLRKVTLYTSSLLLILTASTFALSHGIYLPAVTLMLCSTLGFFARLTYESVQNYREKKQLRSAFSGYVSPPVLKEILSGRIKPGLGGERIYAAVLFADIRNFTTRSESLSPEKTIELLNAYFSEMTMAIQNNGGMIDKFIGDGIMASFGAPQPLENASRSALQAAEGMLSRLEHLNLDLVKRGHTPIAIGIGIHAGDVLAGNVGSESRHEYTLIGDVVNVASRLEGLTKEVGHPVVCSTVVANEATHAAAMHDLGEQAIKGHSKIHVFGWTPSEPIHSTH